MIRFNRASAPWTLLFDGFIQTLDSVGQDHPVGKRHVSILSNTGTTLKVWNARHRTRRQLANLDDRLLKDINLDRVDVEREISKPFWQE